MTIAVKDLPVNDIASLAQGWRLSLRARNRSQATVRSYLKSLQLFREFLVASGMPVEVDVITRDDVEAFIADQLERWRPKTAQIRYGDIRQFFNWCMEGDEIVNHPMDRMKPPVVPEVPVPVVSDPDLRKLLKAAGGSTFENRRDTAILRVLIDCGLRLAELVGLRVEDVDFDLEAIVVLGKGRRPRGVPFGSKTGQAIDRYLRLRGRHPREKSPALWLGNQGPLTDSGVAQMLRRRCDEARIDRLHPHQLRHTAAHAWLAAGGQETDAMRLFGWRSRQMLNRYGASAADERAREAYHRLSPGDRV